MYTDPKIVTSDDPKYRSFVIVYIDGKRHRFYNGKQLDIVCNPNLARSPKERNRALKTLAYHLQKKLDGGWKPLSNQPLTPKAVATQPAEKRFTRLLEELSAQDLSTLYKRDLKNVGDEFIAYLTRHDLGEIPITLLDSCAIEDFLKQFRHSSTYYMNKRRTLGGIFSRLVQSKELRKNPVHETEKLKEKATLHQAYTKEQLRTVLNALEVDHSNLHLCALLMYGCFLRPHQEIRQLFRRDLSSNLSSICLSGNANKSGNVRTVFVPHYVHDIIITQSLHEIDVDANLFTRCCDIFNESYFNTAWTRAKETLLKRRVITDKHTLYSFRHTAAVNLYMKTKDPYKVQQALGHSAMTVTLTYLRSLGLVNNISEHDAPEL